MKTNSIAARVGGCVEHFTNRTGCSAQWISVALADLPVLTQMALNIAALVATLQAGKQLSPAEARRFRTFPRKPARS